MIHIAMVPHDHAGRGASCCTHIRGTYVYWGSVGSGRLLARNDSLKVVCRLDCMPGGGCERSRNKLK